MTRTDWRLLLFRLERAGDPKRVVTRDELQSVCREAKYAIEELLAEGERGQWKATSISRSSAN